MPNYTIEDLLRALVANQGSDLHITAGSPPRIRINGFLRPLNLPAMTPNDARRIIYSMLTQEQIARFEKERELDTAFGLSGVGRFRVNAFCQRSAVAASLRTIPFEISGFRDLGLPVRLFEHLCAFPKGLVLVTGPLGTGKSTTLAAMIDHINTTDDGHIVTIEDPIEFLHRNKRCLVNQREVGNDTRDFSTALKHIIRQDPDTIFISELCDTETVKLAFELAETGHLILASMNTAGAVQSVGRLIEIFPRDQQPQVRTQLSFVLEAVVSQQLVAVASGSGRCPALEVLFANAAVRSHIRDDRMHQIYAAIQTGAREGMVTMNASLVDLVAQGRILRETALTASARVDELTELLDIQKMRNEDRSRRDSTRVW